MKVSSQFSKKKKKKTAEEIIIIKYILNSRDGKILIRVWDEITLENKKNYQKIKMERIT